MTDKKYQVIYCDPPWHYNNRKSNGAAVNHYPTMKQNELIKMRSFIDDIADTPCFLLMWATYPLLAESLELVNAWGFTYKTVAFTWVKKYANGNYSIGGGNYTRSNAEICLLGLRGKNFKVQDFVKNRAINQIIETNDQGKRIHSRKPSETKERIDLLFGKDVNKIELFARETSDGWDHWGNEVDKLTNVK
ncbi:MAG: DNA methyltransferase [Gammaproteobacteria bacterium]|nr:DNA methyltransferase [Gammaproteobacteria bacterium]